MVISIYGSFCHASLDEVNRLFLGIKSDLTHNSYERALGKAKYYRIKFLAKEKEYFNYRILLAEAYILRKFCYETQVSQILELIKYYDSKHNVQIVGLDKISKNLQILGLGNNLKSSKKDEYFENKNVWPISANEILKLKSFNMLKVEVESKC